MHSWWKEKRDQILEILKTLVDWEEGGGFRMGNTCIPVAYSF